MASASMAPLDSTPYTNLHMNPYHVPKMAKVWIAVSVAVVFMILAAVAIYCYINVRRELCRRRQQQQQVQQQQVQHGMELVAVLPRRIYHVTSQLEEEQLACSICLEDFEDQEELVELPGCMHLFHGKCIEPWLRRHGECPICRGGV